MPFAVVLLLDRATSRVVGVWETLDVARAEVALGAFARETPTVPVSFVDVRQFAGSAVYLAPTLSAPLRDAYRRAHAAFGALGGVPAAHFTPVAWVPHCTLAMNLTHETSHTAWALAQAARLPLDTRLERVAIVEFPPARVHGERPLTGR